MSVFGTYEWAVKNYNIISGCSHDCKYCYSKEMAIRFKRKTPDTWKNEELLNSSTKNTIKKVNGQIMFPSSHDITPENLNHSLNAIKNILNSDNRILIVSKPHLSCISKICEEFEEKRQNILFRFSIGSSNNNILRFWESNAPLFEERLKSLQFAFGKGFKTSVSCEPMLDNNIDDVIKEVEEFVTDSIWIGKMNFLTRRLKINGYCDDNSVKMAQELMEWQADDKIIDLYNRLEDNTKIKWKESIKKVLDIEISEINGLDK